MYEESLRRSTQRRENQIEESVGDLSLEQLYGNRDTVQDILFEEYQFSEDLAVHDDEIGYERTSPVTVEAHVPYTGKEEEIRLEPRNMDEIEKEREPDKVTEDHLVYKYNVLEMSAEEIREDVEDRIEPVVENAERLDDQLDRTNGYLKRKIGDVVDTRHEKAKLVVERLKKLDALDDDDEMGSGDIEELPPA